MGEAAEWDIWRRYGVDISDDGYLENPPKRKRRNVRKSLEAKSPVPKGMDQTLRDDFDISGIRSYDDAVSSATSAPPGPAYETTARRFGKTEVMKQIAKGTNAMTTTNAREAIALIQLHNGAKLYGVKFMAEGFVKPDQKTYTYKDTQGLHLSFGDLVIVEARDAFGIAQVVDLNVSPSEAHVELAKVRHIVQKIDLNAHRQRLAIENEAAQKWPWQKSANGWTSTGSNLAVIGSVKWLPCCPRPRMRRSSTRRLMPRSKVVDTAETNHVTPSW